MSISRIHEGKARNYAQETWGGIESYEVLSGNNLGNWISVRCRSDQRIWWWIAILCYRSFIYFYLTYFCTTLKPWQKVRRCKKRRETDARERHNTCHTDQDSVPQHRSSVAIHGSLVYVLPLGYLIEGEGWIIRPHPAHVIQNFGMQNSTAKHEVRRPLAANTDSPLHKPFENFRSEAQSWLWVRAGTVLRKFGSQALLTSKLYTQANRHGFVESQIILVSHNGANGLFYYLIGKTCVTRKSTASATLPLNIRGSLFDEQ